MASAVTARVDLRNPLDVYPEALVEALEVQVTLGQVIEVSDLALDSRCEGWKVRDVLNHSIAVTRKFSAFARVETDTPRTPHGDQIGKDHRLALRSAARDAEAAWRNADLSRSCHLAFGTFTAPMAAGINLFDLPAHSWDIADPTTSSLRGADHLWEAGLSAALTVIGPVGTSITSHPLTAGSDLPREQFLAFLGRSDADRPAR